MSYENIPWETIVVLVFGVVTYVWHQLNGNGALAAKGVKWQILTYIIDGVIQMTYRTYIKKYDDLTKTNKVSPQIQRVAMNVAIKETKARAVQHGISLPILQENPSSEAQLSQLIESRIAVAKSAKAKRKEGVRGGEFA